MTPFGRGLALGLVDAIADGPAAVEPVAANVPVEVLAVPPPQPEMASATIPLTSSRFDLRMGSRVLLYPLPDPPASWLTIAWPGLPAETNETNM